MKKLNHETKKLKEKTQQELQQVLAWLSHHTPPRRKEPQDLRGYVGTRELQLYLCGMSEHTQRAVSTSTVIFFYFQMVIISL